MTAKPAKEKAPVRVSVTVAPASESLPWAHSTESIKRLTKPRPKRNRAHAPEDFKTSTLQIRVKDDVKEKATATLDRIGISLPEAVRVFLGRIVSEQAFPFPLEVPNAETAAALRESIASTASRKRYTSAEDMFDELEKGADHQYAPV